QSGLGGGGLLIDKLATDGEGVGQAGDGLRAGGGLQSQRQALARCQRLGGAAIGNCLLQRKDRRAKMAHVCFLHETGGGDPNSTSLGETDILENLNLPPCQPRNCYLDLNQAEILVRAANPNRFAPLVAG